MDVFVLTDAEIEHRRYLRAEVCYADRKLVEAREALAVYEHELQRKTEGITA